MDRVTLLSLPKTDQVRLKNSAKKAQSLEDTWAARISSFLESLTPMVVAELEKTGRPPEINLEVLFGNHFFDVSIQSMNYAMRESEEHSYLPPGTGRKLSRPPKAVIPKSLSDLMKLYDKWRRGKYKPKRAIAQAQMIQKEYLKRVSSVWEKHSAEWRSGEVSSQQQVIKAIKEEAQTTARRAAGIVRTETTNYYNKARKEFYDLSPDITHYLFVAIRDAATSPWCTPKTTKGMRGRSGLVYSKKDPLCDKERPACHPYCRSEFLPLNRLNPAHLRFIQDEKIQRRNHKCYPLLPNWKAA